MEKVEKGYTKNIIDKITREIKKVVVEQDELLKFNLISLLCGGHVLIEGVPGLAKTLMVRGLSRTINIDFKKIQFTPDLMPADVTGTKIFNMQTREFELKKGPVFTNFLLADEINRTPPKTQAGLLEAMEEQTVTIDGEIIRLPNPYMIFATQNPIEYEGTYPLSEALLDRFLIKLIVDYPSISAEKEVLNKYNKGFTSIDLDRGGVSVVCSAEDILKCRREINNTKIDDDLIGYIISIVSETRNHPFIEIGSSPRGSIALLYTSKAHAVMSGRDFVIPEDIKSVSIPCLRHRIILKPEVQIQGTTEDEVLESILSGIKVPR
ncbi:AAA family ATPase [Maledivibacter halophilus]|uniref:MoxR-like ATPase n=1 Tax=Maledivibacter halophilus TaxID=36842 RepID=A0A1T5J7A8_9FIRM|nr:MoxR family ATPase [Maledivibacter halophilus]SKC47133.1 MoxR-like ATPase [Maledivibacter halophilus]